MSVVRYCTNCGHELGSDDRFCPNCGTPAHQAAYVPTPEADVTVPPSPAGVNPSLNLFRGGVFRKIAALPTWAKALLVLVVLVVLGMSILLSPLVVVLAFLVLIVAVLALVIQLLRRASARRWGIIAAMSLIVLLERVMNWGENRIGMRILRSARSPAVLCFPHS